MRSLLNTSRSQHGMTMIELMVTIAILAVLLGVAIPSMTRFIADWRVTNTINAVTGSLRLARTEAIARARPVVMCRVASDTSTACLPAAGEHGFASGWIVFVRNDGGTTLSYSATTSELLLRQTAPTGIADITLKTAGGFVFLPNGLLNSNANSLNVDANGFDKLSTTPWARKGLCIGKPGRISRVADNSDC